MRRFMAFLAGTLAGALVGAVAALLLAPSSGDELRASARHRVSALRDDLSEAYSARKAQLEAELEGLRKPKGSSQA